MQHPVVAGNRSCKVAVEEGRTYYFCRCGRSANQPFCDGSHKGTTFEPKRYIAEKHATQYWCACKHTGKEPHCDGTHRKFSADAIGKAYPL